MSLNDELLNLDKKIKYYNLETFKNIPSESGVYAWFYPLRIQGTDLMRLIEDVNFIFNFCHDSSDNNPKINFSMGWKNCFFETEFKKLSEESALLKSWEDLVNDNLDNEKSQIISEMKKIIFISSVFMPPLYVGKTINLHSRCYQHILGNGDNNIFHNRFKKHTSKNKKISCKEVEDLFFACISTKQFGLDGSNYEGLFEQILMNLIKPIFSVK